MNRLILSVIIFSLLLFPLITFGQGDTETYILKSIDSETICDLELEKAILASRNFGTETEKDARYYYNRVDLNGDKQPEVLVFLFGRPFCGSGGCKMLLFQKVKGKYKLVTYFSPVRNPIIVSVRKTNGWNDLIFYNSGGGIPGYYSRSTFNGKTYPANPTVESDSQPITKGIKGVQYLIGNYSYESGLRFYAK
jgi:hypothetical protein